MAIVRLVWRADLIQGVRSCRTAALPIHARAAACRAVPARRASKGSSTARRSMSNVKRLWGSAQGTLTYRPWRGQAQGCAGRILCLASGVPFPEDSTITHSNPGWTRFSQRLSVQTPLQPYLADRQVPWVGRSHFRRLHGSFLTSLERSTFRLQDLTRDTQSSHRFLVESSRRKASGPTATGPGRPRFRSGFGWCQGSVIDASSMRVISSRWTSESLYCDQFFT
jgi:hypothetical protein